jgi:two-component system OmpR family sensor kinase
MHSLFVRIFVLFWVAMALIVAGSVVSTITIATREFESPEVQRRPNLLAIEASQVLSKGGLPALKAWLNGNKNAMPDRNLYIIGPDGKDILGRHLSEMAARRLEFFNRDVNGSPDRDANGDAEPRPPGPPPPGNFRPLRSTPQIVGPDGTTYTVLSVPRRPSIFGALSVPGISMSILAIALAVSALASWWLARHLSTPIRRIQEGARTLASEKLDAGVKAIRVSAGLEDRKDEVAVLARDFDTMADQLRANRAGMTQLLRDVSHELRSPLARMRVAVGLARHPGGDVVRQMDRLELEIERLDSLISQVLKLARLQGTDVALEREKFDLLDALEQIVHDANFEGAVKGCRVLLSGSGAPILGNRELLSSAIENVLRNAVRYSPPEATVEVSLRRAGPGAGQSIVIRDHGPGVPAAELERIFEPFHRVAESRDRDSGGEGIGLAITSQVMRAHGGSARASNHPSGGLEVTLTLGELS